MLTDQLPEIEFNEALKDSPRFRQSIKQHEQYLIVLETRLKDILRLCQTMIEFGKNYVSSFYNLVNGIQELNGQCFVGEPDTIGAFDIVCSAYGEILKFQKVLVEQAHWSIVKNLSDFMKRELEKVKEQRKHFQKVSETLEDAIEKKAAVNKGKDPEIFESTNQLTAVGTCFAHTALDYAFQLNLVQAKKNHEILDAFVSFLSAIQTYFHQGHAMFEYDWETKQSMTQNALSALKEKSKAVERKMQDRHMLVPKEVFQHHTGMSPDPDVVMEGYLFKRASNALKQWHRRWFMIRANQLLYCHRPETAGSARKDSIAVSHKTTPDGLTVMEGDLRLCLVRPAGQNCDRLCCFELVTPTKCHMLQADSESLCTAWVKALQRSIESAIYDDIPPSSFMGDDESVSSSNHSGENPVYPSQQSGRGGGGTMSQSASTGNIADGGLEAGGLAPPNRYGKHPNNSHTTSNTPNDSPRIRKRKALEELRNVAGNQNCADCGSPNPKWASINLGITLCIECCGIHRSLGVQVSKVRSLTLDEWEPEQLRLMAALGNSVVNEAYLPLFRPQFAVPPPANPNSSRAVREAWIKAKYVDKIFARPGIERIAERENDLKLAALSRDLDLHEGSSVAGSSKTLSTGIVQQTPFRRCFTRRISFRSSVARSSNGGSKVEEATTDGNPEESFLSPNGSSGGGSILRRSKKWKKELSSFLSGGGGSSHSNNDHHPTMTGTLPQQWRQNTDDTAVTGMAVDKSHPVMLRSIRHYQSTPDLRDKHESRLRPKEHEGNGTLQRMTAEVVDDHKSSTSSAVNNKLQNQHHPESIIGHIGDGVMKDLGNAIEFSGKISQAVRLNSSYGSDTDIAGLALDLAKNSNAEARESARIRERNVGLTQAARAGDVISMCRAFAAGASPSCRCTIEIETDNGRQTIDSTPLHQAVHSGSDACVEFLLINGAKLNMIDSDQNTPLHLAAFKGHTNQVCQLIKRGANHDLLNNMEQKPLDLAMEKLHVDIITVLRMRAEVKDEIDDWDQEALKNYMQIINQILNNSTPRHLSPAAGNSPAVPRQTTAANLNTTTPQPPLSSSPSNSKHIPAPSSPSTLEGSSSNQTMTTSFKKTPSTTTADPQLEPQPPPSVTALSNTMASADGSLSGGSASVLLNSSVDSSGTSAGSSAASRVLRKDSDSSSVHV